MFSFIPSSLSLSLYLSLSLSLPSPPPNLLSPISTSLIMLYRKIYFHLSLALSLLLSGRPSLSFALSSLLPSPASLFTNNLSSLCPSRDFPQPNSYYLSPFPPDQQGKRASFVDVVGIPEQASAYLLHCIPIDKDDESNDFSGIRVSTGSLNYSLYEWAGI